MKDKHISFVKLYATSSRPSSAMFVYNSVTIGRKTFCEISGFESRDCVQESLLHFITRVSHIFTCSPMITVCAGIVQAPLLFMCSQMNHFMLSGSLSLRTHDDSDMVFLKINSSSVSRRLNSSSASIFRSEDVRRLFRTAGLRFLRSSSNTSQQTHQLGRSPRLYDSVCRDQRNPHDLLVWCRQQPRGQEVEQIFRSCCDPVSSEKKRSAVPVFRGGDDNNKCC
ncbi:uncharacterized protein LOC115012336 [Cottoperca gobio]|uniref:Uncharacterized protein LOC115012336 n=1 Tax=Cottoperca gobio TaxID=56716 RepID=A0A6J2Q8K3_COTGO|nr:uncharacterized protein LOC115012336 [Cottoperca gobio]